MRGRELHQHILAEIERRLAGRSWRWLARQAGVPRTTLVTQATRPKFSLEVVLRVANALDVEAGSFLPQADATASTEPEPTKEEIIAKIEGYLHLLRDEG